MAPRIDSLPEAFMSEARPVLYTYPGCGYTTDLKRELRRDGVEYDEVDLFLRIRSGFLSCWR